MEALFFLIPLALIFCAIIVKAFFWAVSHHQFDNLDSAAHSILFDEDERAGIDIHTDATTPPARDDEQAKQ